MDESDLTTAMAAFRRAVGLAGGQSALAAVAPLTQQTISNRLIKGIPLQSGTEVLAVEAATGVSRHDLRPDLYPREDVPEVSSPVGQAEEMAA